MTARHHSAGQDRWANPGGQTAWQRERAHGRLLPMEAPRTGWRARLARLIGRA